MAQANKTPLQTAFPLGLFFGIVLGVSQIVLILLIFLIAPYSSGLVLLLARATQALEVLAYCYAGFRATRQTGQMITGTLAGAFTALFGVAALFVLGNVIFSFWHSQMLLDPLSTPFIGGLVSSSSNPIVNYLLHTAIYGAVMGTIGGFVGRNTK